MRELTGNLWEVETDAVVITTNGVVRKDGCAVMGRGVAKQAAERMPRIAGIFGKALQVIGNHVINLGYSQTWGWIFSFPVKEHWRDTASLELIERSARELVDAVDRYEFGTVALPRPGCGNGGLRWKDVRPVIEPLLDDRFVVVER